MLKIKPKNLIFLLLYALPNTILSFGIVYVINNTLGGKEEFLKDYMAISFLALVGYTYLLNVIFQKALNKFSFNLLYENEKAVFSQILKVPLQKLEKLGSHRFFTAIEDLGTFSQLPFTVTHTINSILMLVLCIAYMFTLSVVSALIVIGLIMLVAGCYFLVMKSMSKEVEKLKKCKEDYYKYVDDVMKGFKGFKLSFFRRESLMNNFLIPNRNEAMDLDFKVNYVYLSINLISQYGLYFILAVILFILPELDILARRDVISYVVIILFISGPINNLTNLQQIYTRFIVANARLKKFKKDFEMVEDQGNFEFLQPNYFASLCFNDISFSYETNVEKSFALGPVNLEIKKGETIFVIGGNGSGKSTFINVLTGLYKPTSGNIIINDEDSDDAISTLQALISAVFTDNYLFSNNYDDYNLKDNKNYLQLLKTMQLDELVTDDTEQAARRLFSKGQSKRMSLIFALLENKPVIVLDEWAADQDPHFRKYFYEELLPKLKKEGKTIIAVTHDDAYFHLADRILKFDYGNISKDVKGEDVQGLKEYIWS